MAQRHGVGRAIELAWVTVALVAACGGDVDGRDTAAGSGNGITTIPGGGTDDGDTGDADDSLDPFPDVGSTPMEGGPGGEEECAAQVTPAENKKQPADIIVVVDNSGSMDFEAGAVQDNLNTFSQQIVDSGIDVRVVLISSYPGDGNGICIDAPLGSGGCPDDDDNPPLFTHIDHGVGSNEALQAILADHGQWSAVVRQGAALHFMVVTDDESDIEALSFDAELKALDMSYADYIFNGIVCTTECEETADIGQVYIALGMLTGGIVADLCLQDFQPVFDQLATEVIEGAELACEWDVPAPPPGEEFDPAKVNVAFDDGMGGGFEIGYVDSEAACTDVIDGWYYDDPVAPTKIFACAQTCQKIQGAELATIEITLGCETVPAPAG
ncbi:MAG: hypothetical protein IAG13_02755 [Deltaproteobacteria bacterium]|nr:hypothetical protein [Nannocystaceae bacterium]